VHIGHSLTRQKLAFSSFFRLPCTKNFSTVAHSLSRSAFFASTSSYATFNNSLLNLCTPHGLILPDGLLSSSISPACVFTSAMIYYSRNAAPVFVAKEVLLPFLLISRPDFPRFDVFLVNSHYIAGFLYCKGKILNLSNRGVFWSKKLRPIAFSERYYQFLVFHNKNSGFSFSCAGLSLIPQLTFITRISRQGEAPEIGGLFFASKERSGDLKRTYD
jgi:hypothetical protein